MELRHLRYFIAVAETENVTRAAQRLHVSQPALSRQIRDLEEELGFALFERSAKSVRLTPAGQSFLQESRAVLSRADAAVQAARSVAIGSGVEVHVGYAASPTAKIFPSILRAFQLEMPKARVKLHDLSTEEMLHRLKNNQLDAALMVKPGPSLLRGLHFEVLGQEKMRLAVGRKHPLARKASIKLNEILNQPFIGLSRAEYPDYYEWWDALFASFKTRPKILEEHDSISSLIASVEACTGVALISESVECLAGTRLKFLRFTPDPKPLSIGIAWPKSGKQKPATSTFIQCAKRASSSISRM
jgi:DNA-binding transcriptional LysR family regulator